MDVTKPLHEQLAECELWCAQRREEEYREVATKGLRVLPGHHGELAKPLPGQTPQAAGWLLRSDVIGFGSWLLLVGLMLVGVVMCFVMTFELVDRTDHPFLYAAVIFLLPSFAVVYFPLRMIMRRHELIFGDDALVVRRLVFGRLNKEWRLPVADEVRVGLAYRGARLSGKHGSYAQLSVVVASADAEIAFGDDLNHEERARLAILIDHYFNGVA